jgi:ribosomal protein S18 acetylase RimI-like enzyme
LNIELYFLRSSEEKIVKDMLPLAHGKECSEFKEYTENFGLTHKDLGLYALVDNKIAGAIWSREIDSSSEPTLSIAVLPELRSLGIGSHMMQQFLLEAGAKYSALSTKVPEDVNAVKFYEKFGFNKDDVTDKMFKSLEVQEVVRPTDGYNPKKWMD